METVTKELAEQAELDPQLRVGTLVLAGWRLFDHGITCAVSEGGRKAK